MSSDAYRKLETLFHELFILESAGGILGWDSATFMPDGGAERRGEQLALIGRIAHEWLVKPELGDWFAAAEAAEHQLTEWQAANLREMKHRWQHATAVEPKLAEALSRAGSECEFIWRSAKKDNDFARLAPRLEEVIRLVREVAAQKGAALGLAPYDAMLDQYDPGTRRTWIDPVFAQLEAALPALIDRALVGQAERTYPQWEVPIAEQEAVGPEWMRLIGLDAHSTRLDTSMHPFCGGSPSDIRITARYDASDPLSSLMAVMHESGHALYEQQLPAMWVSQPVGQARGMALHESQSLFVEMQLGRSHEFAGYAAPILAQYWQIELNAEQLYQAQTKVARSLIRVDADELTYPLHVILRYRLEQQLLDGSLAVRDLPEAWNAMMQELLGITPPDDASGCMQDIHWMDGSLGYFPTYTMGALIAAQLARRMQDEVPDWRDCLAKGEWKPIRDWLAAHVHGRASFLSAPKLIEEATGAPLDATCFLAHLEERYCNP